MAQDDPGLFDDKANTVFLLDGTYTVFRSFYAVAPLTAPDGTPTNGVYGFVSQVRKLIEREAPDHFAVAFDIEGPTFRDELFADYKANRSEPPEDLVPQFGLATRACEVMGWPVMTAEGFEADDVLATLAQQALDRGLRVVIVTADKDLYQLVENRVQVLNPSKGDRLLDADGVREIFGVSPCHVIDVLALMGDKVDNVPGVPGIGEKGARKLVNRYGPVAKILERARLFRTLWLLHERALEELASGEREALKESLEQSEAPARSLAALERELGGTEGTDLAARFEAVADLAGSVASSKDRELRKVLKDMEKKTQPKTWLSLAENEKEAHFSLDLVILRRDAPVELDLAMMVPGQPRTGEAAEFFRGLGFRRLSAEMEERAGREAPCLAEQLEVRIVDDASALGQLSAQLASAPRVAVDTETDSLDPRQARLVGVSLAIDGEGGAYIPCLEAKQAPLLWEMAWEEFCSQLARSDLPKTGQNLKFDRAVLRGAGVTLRGIESDTLIAAQLLEPGRTVSHKLDDLAWRYLGVRMVSYAEIAGAGSSEKTLDQLGVEEVAEYAVEDAVVAFRLTARLEEELEKEGLGTVYRELEIPLISVLEAMEARGIRLDTERLSEISERLALDLARLEQEIHALAGREFNISSPAQLRVVLFEDLGLKPTGRRTQKTKAHSTGQEAMEALAPQHPLPAKVLEFRELAKLKGTYVDALPRLVEPSSGRVHTQFHQLGAATGRLSSSDPNLQNIPARTALGRQIRAAFLPREGWRLIAADYSQMELRVLAHLSGDESLIEAFTRGLDVHRYTAALVQGIPIEDVSGEERSHAKAVNFGIIYGMSEFRLAREQGMSRDEARRFIDAYFDRYPRVKAYIDRVHEEVEETGEVRTLFGRLRRFEELAKDGASRLNRMQREQLLRQAVNTTVQGSAADIVKRAMLSLDRRLGEEGFAASLLLQVHDELVLEAPVEELSALETLLREVMEGAAELVVPLTVDVHSGINWAAAHA